MLSGENLSTQQGEGGANILNWNYTDNAINLLHKQEQERQQMGYKDYLASQQSLNKELGGIRAADIPEGAQKFNDWKQARQNVLFNKKLQRDPVAYAAAQKDVNTKYADALHFFNTSKEYGTQLKNTSTDANIRSENYDPNIHSYVADAVNLPTSEAIIKYPVEKMMFNGQDEKWAKTVQGAVDKSAQSFDITESKQDDPLNKISSSYKAYNPNAIYNNILNGAYQNGTSQNLKWGATHPPPDFNAISQRYEEEMKKLPEQVKEKMGIKGNDIQQQDPTSPISQYAAYVAKKEFLVRLPEILKQTNIPNGTKVLDAKKKEKRDFYDYQLKHPKPSSGGRGGNGTSSSADPGMEWVNNTALLIQKGDPNAAIYMDNVTKGGQGKYQIEGVGYQANGAYRVKRKLREPVRVAGKPREQDYKEEVIDLNPGDPSFMSTLVGLWTGGTGSDVKAKGILGDKVNQGTPSQKTYKFNNKPISIDAIQKAAKASGMTVDEYIKKAGIQ